MKMLKIGVFGVGHLGKFHLQNWKEVEGVELTGFHDPDDEKAREASERFGIRRFTDPDELMDAVDAVDIVVPTDHHYGLCVRAIRKGRHVFVEKPMTDTVEQAREIMELVKESGVKFQVGHVERFNPAFLSLAKYPLNPMFIEVHRLAEFNPRGTEVSVILDLMIHDIDIILHIVKSHVKKIHASGVAVMTEKPDIANVRIEFENGCVANLTSSRISMKKMRKMRLFQKDAYIAIDFLEKKSEVIKMKGPEDADLFSFDIETPQGTRTLAIDNPRVAGDNAIRKELTAFRDSILLDRPTIVSEWDGFMAMDVAHRILEKIKNGLPSPASAS
jgi:predicted dehydrogenase